MGAAAGQRCCRVPGATLPRWCAQPRLAPAPCRGGAREGAGQQVHGQGAAVEGSLQLGAARSTALRGVPEGRSEGLQRACGSTSSGVERGRGRCCDDSRSSESCRSKPPGEPLHSSGGQPARQRLLLLVALAIATWRCCKAHGGLARLGDTRRGISTHLHGLQHAGQIAALLPVVRCLHKYPANSWLILRRCRLLW